jgi:voltage-gated sodium channel
MTGGLVSARTEPVESGAFGRMAQIARSAWFARFIVMAIAMTAILSGLETYSEFRRAGPAASLVDWLQDAVLAIFVVEIVIKIGSFGTRPWRYFQAGWNAFDFTIVAFCLMPLNAEYVVVLRLLRTLRLFTALPGLQVLVSGLLRGIPSLGYVGLLLLLHFYIYAVIGTFAFGDNDPIRFGNLHTSMLTLFQVLTLEGWNDILSTQYLGSDVGYDDAWKSLPNAAARISIARPIAAAAYFISFILIGTMIMLNLFTGVIIRSMEEAHIESAEAARKRRIEAQHPSGQREELRQLSEQLEALARRLATIDSPQEVPIRNSAGEPASRSPAPTPGQPESRL